MKNRTWRTLVVAALLNCGFALRTVQADPASTPLSALAGKHLLSSTYAPGDVYMGIRLLGSIKLAPVEPQGLPMVELSGLAFDQDENILYALSDRGRIYHLRPHFENLLLKDISVLAVYPLMDAQDKPLKGRMADSEGLLARHARNTVNGDTELVISFERRHRILRFSPQGHFLGALKLPSRLANTRRYRSPNQGIEAIAYDPRYGFLAAPERPFRDATNKAEVEIVALGDPNLFWRYPLAPEANAALVGMEILDDGSLLTLERAHGRYFVPFITSIRHVRSLRPGQKQPLEVETLARLSTAQGWKLDNFEGLARHIGNRFFMVSDDNAMIYQSTLLSYFEVLEHDPLQRIQPESSLKSQ